LIQKLFDFEAVKTAPNNPLNRLFYICLASAALVSLLMHHGAFRKELIGIHVWRQTETQSTIDNFYHEDMSILNPRKNERGNGTGISRKEFPLMQWLVALTYQVTGRSVLVTRIWMFVIGLFSVAGMYMLIRFVLQREFPALLGAWAFNFSPAFYYYTLNPLPDNLALCFGIWGLALFIMWIRIDKISLLIWSGIFLSLGTLCKLPFVLYCSLPALWFLLNLKASPEKARLLKQGFIYFLPIVVPLLWYASVIGGWEGNGIVQGITAGNHSLVELLDFLKYHFVSTLPELLLNYASLPFFLAAIYYLIKTRDYKRSLFLPFLVCVLAVTAYVVFEINMIERVHDYYLFPFYPFLFVLVGYGAGKIVEKGPAWRWICLALCVLMPITAWLRMGNKWNESQPGFNPDLLLYRDQLRMAVPDSSLCIVGNDISHHIFFYYINKKGWVFDSDNFTALQIKDAVGKGARYMYSDSRVIDGNPEIAKLLGKKIMESGSIRIFELNK